MGGIESFDATCRFLASESGVAVVSVGYRLAPEYRFPSPLDDAWAATRWVRDHSQLLGVDCHRMVVIGESAGGNLAAVVCLLAREAQFACIRLQVLIYPAVDARLQADSLRQFASGYLQTANDVEYAFKIYGLGSTVSCSDWRISPLLAASHENLPPALLISAGLDVLRDDSFAYTRCLLNAGVAATHVCYPGMVHTFFGMREIIPDSEYAQRQVAFAMRSAVEKECST
jgi:acetyl esterase